MTIGPTVAGGLKLVPEEEKDWLVLLEIARDANGGLSKRLGGLMDEDSMWDEIVVPELAEDFSKQRMEVVMAVMKAKGEGEAIHIDQKSAGAWYGALNQARLELEAKYQFGAREKRKLGEIEDQSACLGGILSRRFLWDDPDAPASACSWRRRPLRSGPGKDCGLWVIFDHGDLTVLSGWISTGRPGETREEAGGPLTLKPSHSRGRVE